MQNWIFGDFSLYGDIFRFWWEALPLCLFTVIKNGKHHTTQKIALILFYIRLMTGARWNGKNISCYYGNNIVLDMIVLSTMRPVGLLKLIIYHSNIRKIILDFLVRSMTIPNFVKFTRILEWYSLKYISKYYFFTSKK